MSRKKVKELPQGAIETEALPELPADDEPQYPTVLQGVKNNMAKFDNCVLLTRVGNFYEMYFEQAEEFGPLLSLKVGYRQTKMGPVAMAGFPFFQLDRFLKTLVQDLQKYVAICDEFLISVSDKVKSGGLKHDRWVTRVVTPGTLIDEKFLDPYENNFLLSVHPESSSNSERPLPSHNDVQTDSTTDTEQIVGLAWLDLSTGDFFTQTVARSSLSSALTRIAPREIVLPADIVEDIKDEVQQIVGHDHRLLTLHQSEDDFTTMLEWNGMLEGPVDPNADEIFKLAEKQAGHQLLDYVKLRLQGLQLRLQPPRRKELHEILSIDRSSLRGLEILETARDGLGRGSLFHAVKRTVTKSGSRLLRDRLTSPSASLPEINERLDLVSMFFESEELTESVIFRLRRTYDVQRIVQKFALNKGDADDMLSLATAISETVSTRDLLQSSVSTDESPLRRLLLRFDLEGPVELQTSIFSAIDEEGLQQKHRLEEDEAASVAALAHDVVLQSAPEELDSLPKAVRSRSKSEEPNKDDIVLEEPWIMRRNASDILLRLHQDLDDLEGEKLALAERLRTELSAPTLTLKSTPGLGYICHIRSATGFNRAKLESLHARMVSSSKSTRSFYLSDWTRLGRRIDQAILNIRDEEKRIFASLRQGVILNLVKLRRNAAVMDELDVASAFATLAREQSWIRPTVNTGTEHKIIGGRHPMVKLGLEEQGRSFVSNNLVLDHEERIWLVTGPNMGGKSTFLRQNALLTILAQTGSYVPATHAEIGLVDQIFSRIGAADDLFRDQSTFMVEMLETAAILKHATPRSFVIMDEVGRGTTPEDGTAVGYASLHHLYHINKCRTLFATHFHALTDMTGDWKQLACYCTDVLESDDGSFAFVHRLKKGINRQSHALKVAKLAGLPPAALKVAEDILQHISSERSNLQRNATQNQENNQTSSIAAAG
ncbi:MutS protein 1 [Elasticomyces elasticus]|uniref:DNA mismatch repair protein MSH3 n=1 Tax=Exophiala sideris TaxID=1016849 RepID=A0ABR0J1B7_9EURO|nr:MutS protein 1 [Elasticomyces elasticus]KAK5024446.1 MutS protein 1 [Exophiala sideris]KAK5030872.1 MutS protein 1 [Exophiala sideris]KAK5054179.1 MutS protein 1 [Exophiala sideris]KAK5179465.1 MutS protein 1 [Eurotiomycetes sp. CCFEE 6388]